MRYVEFREVIKGKFPQNFGLQWKQWQESLHLPSNAAVATWLKKSEREIVDVTSKLRAQSKTLIARWPAVKERVAARLPAILDTELARQTREKAQAFLDRCQSAPVTSYDLQLHDRVVAVATRGQVISCFRQVFDELGLTIHKLDNGGLVHWHGARFGKALAALASAPERGYWVTLRSLGDPRVTGVEIRARLSFGWLHPKEKTQKKLDDFTRKLLEIRRAKQIEFYAPDDWQRYEQGGNVVME